MDEIVQVSAYKTLDGILYESKDAALRHDAERRIYDAILHKRLDLPMSLSSTPYARDINAKFLSEWLISNKDDIVSLLNTNEDTK